MQPKRFHVPLQHFAQRASISLLRRASVCYVSDSTVSDDSFSSSSLSSSKLVNGLGMSMAFDVVCKIWPVAERCKANPEGLAALAGLTELAGWPSGLAALAGLAGLAGLVGLAGMARLAGLAGLAGHNNNLITTKHNNVITRHLDRLRTNSSPCVGYATFRKLDLQLPQAKLPCGGPACHMR